MIDFKDSDYLDKEWILSTLNDVVNETGIFATTEVWSEEAQDILARALRFALNESQYGAAYIENEMTAFMSYNKGINHYVRIHLPVQLSNSEYIELEYLAGIGRGGGRFLANRMKAIATNYRLPLIVRSSDEAMLFYDKLGFTRSSTNSCYYWWLPETLHISDKMIAGN